MPTNPPRPPRPLRRAVPGVVYAYVAVLGAMLLAPTSSAPSWLVATTSGLGASIGLPAALTVPERVEFLLNVAAFLPITAAAAWVQPRLSWRDLTAYGFVASLAVEAVQGVALSDRSATHSDVVANTLGALLGALLGHVSAGRRDCETSTPLTR